MADKTDSKYTMSVKDLLVETIMTPKVECMTMSMTVRKVIETILDKKYSGAPIIDQAERVVSVVSESDLIKFAALGHLDKTLNEIADKLTPTKKLITVKKHDPFREVFKKFLESNVRRVLVVDSNGKIQGIVSRSNILRAFLKENKTPAKKP